ncbi:MAG: hypothetical protein N3A69_16720, partial [Leptospiraceae bacterium]|nr:hypothetical protein [Leptospiraceae bacterium]
YMVIGQNIGTTLTAGIAAIGASVSSKRTALIHVLFNVLAGVVAFFLLNLMLSLIHLILSENFDSVSAVVFFHSLFNVLGIFVFLPVLKPISRMVEQVLPDQISNPNRYLDVLLYNTPALALDAVRRSLIEMFRTIIQQIQSGLMQAETLDEFIQIQRMQLRDLMNYFERIPSNHISEQEMDLKNNLLHCMDHLDSLLDALNDLSSPTFDFQVPRVQNLKKELIETIQTILSQGANFTIEQLLEDKSKDLANFRKKTRLEVLESTAMSKFHPELAMKEIDTIRWFDKVHYYLWRFVKHITQHTT